MKKIITLMLALLPLVAFSQQPTNPLPHNILTQQDTIIKFDYAAYQATIEMTEELHEAGQHIINSVLFDVLGAAAFAISADVIKKDNASANHLMGVGVGCVIIGLYMLVNAGLDLKAASKASSRIHPIPNGVSINLD